MTILSSATSVIGNRLVNQLFGSTNGLGFGIFTLDWSQIAYIGSPLVIPWWAEVNVIVGFAFFFWFLGPILYYTNVRLFSFVQTHSFLHVHHSDLLNPFLSILASRLGHKLIYPLVARRFTIDTDNPTTPAELLTSKQVVST